MRITEAARRLDTSPRMLRYRDLLGLLPPVREPAPGRRGVTRSGDLAPRRGVTPAGDRVPGRRAQHRQFGEDDLEAVSLALEIEQRYDISPAALAFGLRVLTEPGARADVAELARRIGRIRPLPARALEFEKERALRLLSLADSPARAGGPSRPGHRRGRRTARTAGSVASARDDSYRSGSR
jgi:MerR family transcriptional regulator, copper efflux regulator